MRLCCRSTGPPGPTPSIGYADLLEAFFCCSCKTSADLRPSSFTLCRAPTDQRAKIQLVVKAFVGQAASRKTWPCRIAERRGGRMQAVTSDASIWTHYEDKCECRCLARTHLGKDYKPLDGDKAQDGCEGIVRQAVQREGWLTALPGVQRHGSPNQPQPPTEAPTLHNQNSGCSSPSLSIIPIILITRPKPGSLVAPAPSTSRREGRVRRKGAGDAAGAGRGGAPTTETATVQSRRQR